MLTNWKGSQPIVNGWVVGSKITGRPLNAMTLQNDYLKPAGDRMGLQGLGWYTFRQCFQTYLNKLETVEAVQETFASELKAVQKGRAQRELPLSR